MSRVHRLYVLLHKWLLFATKTLQTLSHETRPVCSLRPSHGGIHVGEDRF